MTLAICATVIGFLCLTGEPGAAEAYNGIYSTETIRTQAFDSWIMYSDFYQTYYPSEMEKACEDGSCFVYKVTFQECAADLVLFPYRDQQEIGPTGVSYGLSAKDARGMERALADVYVIADEETKRPLFPLSKLIDARRAAETCKH